MNNSVYHQLYQMDVYKLIIFYEMNETKMWYAQTFEIRASLFSNLQDPNSHTVMESETCASKRNQ